MCSLSDMDSATQFVKDQYRHCKPILAIGMGKTLLEDARVKLGLPSGELDPGVLTFTDVANGDEILLQFKRAIAKHRHFEREMQFMFA